MSELVEVETTAPEAMDGAGADFSSVMAFMSDEVTMQTVTRVAGDMGLASPMVEQGGVRAAIDHLGNAPSPELLVVDIGDSVDPMEDINALADVCDAGTKVIAIGNVNDVRFYRDLIEAGVVDYLVKPIMPGDLSRAILDAAGHGQAPAHDNKTDSLFIVTGARGGVGASTVATSLAWLLAEKAEKGAALVDLDLRFGTSALTFDVEPGNGLTEILAEPDRIDPLFLERAGISVNAKLSLFAAEAPLSDTVPMQAAAISVLFEEMLGTRDLIVADIPGDVLVAHPQLIADADQIILITDFSLAGMRDVMRIKKLIADVTPDKTIRLVANTTRPLSTGDLPRSEVEKAVDMKLSCVIPYDAKGTVECSAQGRPLGAHGGKAGAALQELVGVMMGEKSKASGDKGLDQLLAGIKSALKPVTTAIEKAWAGLLGRLKKK